MSKILVIANQKGGVGKTTTAINLAAGLALQGQKILLIDTDPQGNTTSGLGFDHEKITNTIYHFFINQKKIKEIILSTDIKNLYLIPSNMDLIGIEIELVNFPQKEMILKNALQEITDEYNYIILDCPPSLNLLTMNALCAASGIIIPVQCEYYALEGISQLLKIINLIQQNLNPLLVIDGLLLTMYDSRTNLSNQVAKEIREYFGNKVFQTIIPRNVRISESPSFGQPVVIYDKNSVGAQTYLNFAKEVLKNA